MEVITNEKPILTVTANGYGKRTELSDYRLQGRGGSGTITIKTTDRNGIVVEVGGHTLFPHICKVCVPRFFMGRATYGVWGIELAKGDEVVSMEVITNEKPILTVTANGYGKRTELSKTGGHTLHK